MRTRSTLNSVMCVQQQPAPGATREEEEGATGHRRARWQAGHVRHSCFVQHSH